MNETTPYIQSKPTSIATLHTIGAHVKPATLCALIFDVDGTLADTERDGHRIAFNAAFRFLKNRITAFTALPISSIDRLALGNRLRDIGRLDGATSPARVE